ncbi:MAG: phosphatase domain-containing protein [Oligoflexales bacterium]
MLRKQRNPSNSYDLWQLVDMRKFEDLGNSSRNIQIICDIDKTYLETTFESWVKMARIAFEDAEDKITVSGASDVLMAGRWGNLNEPLASEQDEGQFPRPLHFVSSSPSQLRAVLEEKLSLDGLDWSSDTFKNQAYNIKKGRFDLLKHQVAYKTAAILKLMEGQADGISYFLIGDNAESDPFIYLGIKLLIERRLSPQTFESYLEILGVENSVSHTLWQGIKRIPKCKIEAIFIRNLSAYNYFGESPLTDPICLFESFFDVNLYFLLHKLIDFEVFWVVTKSLHNRHGISLHEITQKISECLKSGLAADLAKKLENIIEPYQDLERPNLGFRPESIKRVKFDTWNNLTEKEIMEQAKKWMAKAVANRKSPKRSKEAPNS